MERLQFDIIINAPVSHVYTTMLGLISKTSYEQWTAVFNPTSTYEGTWEEGSSMHFVGVDEQGVKGGVVSRIVQNEPNYFVSIQHYGLIKGEETITSGPDVEKWANGFENYSFEEVDDQTELKVFLDAHADFAEYMLSTYPIALQKLKEMCEG
jgi:hypothetical protein